MAAGGGAGNRSREGSSINLAVKYVLFFINLVTWLVGLTVLVLTAWVLYQKQKIVTNAFDFFFDLSCVLCLAGAITVFISFVGLYGSLRLNVLALNIYKWSLYGILLLEVLAAIFIFVFYWAPDVMKQINIYPEDTFRTAVANYRVPEESTGEPDMDIINLIDTIQQAMECCGIGNDEEGYLDWNLNEYFNCTGPSTEKCNVPWSCCILKAGDPINLQCGWDVLGKTKEEASKRIHTRGCLMGLMKFLENNALVVGGICLGIIIPQIVLACLAGKLADQTKFELHKCKERENRERRAASRSGDYQVKY